MKGYLLHYGVPGMKWGVRRYRNRDGSLTTQGEEQYQSEPANKRQYMYERIARRKQETEYRKLMREQLFGGFVSEGKSLVADVFSSTVKNLKENGDALRFGKYITERFLGNKSAFADSILGAKLGGSSNNKDDEDEDNDNDD